MTLVGRVVRLVITLALLHAAVRVGIVASKYYRLRTSTWEIVVAGTRVPPDRLGDQIFETAVELAVPIRRYDINVRRVRELTTAQGSYTEPVVLLPGFTYPVDLSFSVEASAMQARAVQELKDLTR